MRWEKTDSLRVSRTLAARALSRPEAEWKALTDIGERLVCRMRFILEYGLRPIFSMAWTVLSFRFLLQ